MFSMRGVAWIASALYHTYVTIFQICLDVATISLKFHFYTDCPYYLLHHSLSFPNKVQSQTFLGPKYQLSCSYDLPSAGFGHNAACHTSSSSHVLPLSILAILNFSCTSRTYLMKHPMITSHIYSPALFNINIW